MYQGWQQWTSNSHTGMQTGQMQPYNMMGWGQTQTPYAVPSAQTMGSWPATNMVGTNMAAASTTTTTTSTNQTPAYSTSSYMSSTTPAETKTVSAEDSSTSTTTTTTEVKSTLEDTSNQNQTEKNGTETATAAQPEQQLQPTNSEEEERLNYLRQQAAQWQAHQAQWQQYQYQYQYQYPYTYPQYYPPASDIHQNPLSAISTQPPPPPPASQPPPTTQSQLTSQLGSTFQPPPPPAHPPPPPQLASNQTTKTTQLPSMSQPPPNLSQPPPSLSQTPLSLTQPPPSLSQPPPSLTQTPASSQLLSSNKPQLINHLLLSGQPPGPPPPPNTVTSNQTASGGPLSQSQSFTSQSSLSNQVSGLPPTTTNQSSSQDPLQMQSSQYQQPAKSQHYSSQQSGYSSTSQNYQQHSGQQSAKPFHQMQFSQPPPMKHGDQSQSDSHQSYSDSQHHYNEPPPMQFSQQSFSEPPPMQHPRQQFMSHTQSNQMQQSQYMQHSQPPPQSQQHQSSFSDDSSYNQQYQPPFSKPHQKGSYSQQPTSQSHDNSQFQQQPPPSMKPFQRLTPQAQQRLTPQAQQRLLQQAQQQRMTPQPQQQRLTPQAQQRLTPQAQQRLAQTQQRQFPNNQKLMLSKQPQEMFKDIGDPNSDFERQFQDWVQSFEIWRDENKNHPDQDAFTTYEQQHLQTRNLLLQKKEQIMRANEQNQRMEAEKFENQRFPSQDKKDFGRPSFGQGNFRSQPFRSEWDDSGYGQNRRDGPGFGPNRREGPGFGQNRREGPGFGQRQDNSNFGQNRRGGYDQNRRDEEFYDRSEVGYQRPGQNRQRFSDAEPHEYMQRDEPFDDFDKENMYGNDSQSRSSFQDSMSKGNPEMNIRSDFDNSARNENAANEKLGQMERESDLLLKRDTGEQEKDKDKDIAQKENAENNKNLENTSAKNDGKNELSDKDGESQMSGKDKVRDKFDEDDTEIDGPGNFEPGDEDELNEGSKPKLKPNETSDKTSRMGDSGPRESLLGAHPSQRPSFDFEDSQNSFKSRDSRGRDGGGGQMYGGPGQMGRKRYPSDNGDDFSSGDNRYGKQMRGDDDWKGDNQKSGDRQFGSRRSFSPANQRNPGRRDSWDSSDQYSNDRFDSNRQEENFRGRGGQFNDRFGGRGQERMISPWINNQPPNTLGMFQRGVGNIGIRFQGPLMDQKFNQEPMAIHLQEPRNDGGPFGGNKVEFRFQMPGGECDNKRLPLFPHEIVTNENRDPVRRGQDVMGDKDKGVKQSLLGDGPGPRLSTNRDIDSRGESRFEVSFGSGRFDGANSNRNSAFDRKDRWGRRNMNERSMMDDRMNPMRQKSDMDCGDSAITKSTVEFHFNRGQMIGATEPRPLLDNQDLFGKIMHLVNRYSEHGDLDKGPMQNDRFMDDDDDDEPGFRGRNRGRGRDRQFSRGDRGRGGGGDRDDDRGGRGRRGGDRGRGGRGGGRGGRNDDHDQDGGDRGRNRERGRGRGDRGRGRGRGRGFDRDDWDRNSAESHGTDDLSEEQGRDDEPFFGRRDDDNQGGKNKQDRRRNWNENRFSNRFSQRGGKSFRRDKNFKDNWEDNDEEEEPLNPSMQFSDPFVEPTVTIDYGHKPATEPNLPNIPVVKDYGHVHGFEPEEYNKSYQEFNFAVPQPPVQVAFGRVQMETIDYGHGQGGPRDFPSPERVIDYGHGQPDRSGVKEEFPKMLEDRDDRTELDREKSRERLERGGRERERDHSRGRDRDRERDKDHERSRIREDRDRERNVRDRDKDRDMRDRDRDKDKGRDGDQRSRDFRTFPIDPKYQEMFRKSEPKSETVLIEDLLSMPGRQNRPSHIVIILRGPPGSGKSFVAKLIKDKEVENGGSAPRMLCLDDYFMVETEKNEVDPESGKQVKSKVMEYEYDSEMESSYQTSLLKSFKKTIETGFFPFIIVDAINEKCRHFEEMWSFAKQRGFQVYIAEMDMDSALCHKRNIHGRNLNDITRIIKRWDSTPRHYLRIDIRSLLQDAAIPEVEMEDSVAEEKPSTEACKEVELKTEEETPVESADGLVTSRWEQLEATEEKLDRLDGIQAAKRKKLEHQSLEEYLQLPDDYELRHSEPGKKRVRWADIEERKESDRKRALGFVIGQTDWEKITDPTAAERALAKTKYF